MWDSSTFAIDSVASTLQYGLPEPATRPHRLVLYSGAAAGRSYALADGDHVIGRSPDAQVQIPSPGLSRRHAEILVAGEQVVLRDLDSANGSFRNEQRLVEPTALAEGDVIRLGSVQLKFYHRRSIDALLHDRLYRLAMIDAGTGIYNRRWFAETLQVEFAHARRMGWPLALIAFDFDHFKAVNDRFGHSGGDLVLARCAAAARAVVGDAGLLARIGGEEFAVLLPRAGLAEARRLAERIRTEIERLELELPAADGSGTAPHRQTLSLGVAEMAPTMSQQVDLADAADRQLYAAKQGGRNRVCG